MTNANNTNTDKHTEARIIWHQISTQTKMACGARQPTVNENQLTFKVERKPLRFVRVTLDRGTDLYTVEYFRVKRNNYAQVSIAKAEGIFADMLSETIYHQVNR